MRWPQRLIRGPNNTYDSKIRPRMHQVISRIVLHVDANQTNRVSVTRFIKGFKIDSNRRPVACRTECRREEREPWLSRGNSSLR